MEAHQPRLALVVEPDPTVQRQLAVLLRAWGYSPLFASNLQEGVSGFGATHFLFTLLNRSLTGMDAQGFIMRLRAQGGEPGSIIVLGPPQEMETLSELADDFVSAPIMPEELERSIECVLSRLPRAWNGPNGDPNGRLLREIGLWRSPQMRGVLNIARQAAQVDVTVLIAGETGTGKDLVARAIHHLSPRRSQLFVRVNCAAVPRELLESELFGHERGAFTGAHQLKLGKFESANHGTIFLDEIGDLHPALQAKLLQVLQDGSFSRVGGKTTIQVNVRVLAATNKNLERAVLEGRFREDLYYRLNVIQLLVPPLRERPEDIPGLIEYFVDRYASVFKRPGFALDKVAIDRLCRHRYPGNVRELENLIKRMIVLNDPLLVKNFPPIAPPPEEPRPAEQRHTSSLSLKEIGRSAARAAEREAIARMLHHTGWNRLKAAKLLKISYRALLYKIKDSGLDRSRGDGGLLEAAEPTKS